MILLRFFIEHCIIQAWNFFIFCFCFNFWVLSDPYIVDIPNTNEAVLILVPDTHSRILYQLKNTHWGHQILLAVPVLHVDEFWTDVIYPATLLPQLCWRQTRQGQPLCTNLSQMNTLISLSKCLFFHIGVIYRYFWNVKASWESCFGRTRTGKLAIACDVCF